MEKTRNPPYGVKNIIEASLSLIEKFAGWCFLFLKYMHNTFKTKSKELKPKELEPKELKVEEPKTKKLESDVSYFIEKDKILQGANRTIHSGPLV